VSRRQPRVPGTTRASFRVEVATGVDPERALIDAASTLPLPAGLWRFDVLHDGGCPVIAGVAMRRCTCEIVQLRARRAA
jgi:hypothetical protein